MRYTWLVGIGFAMLAGAPALAQQANGVVTYLKTPEGSVLVERGSEIYRLAEGDVIFAGDKIFTRTNGAMRFSYNGCDVGLGGQQMIQIDAATVCTVPPVSLAANESVGGIVLGTGGEVSATPTILTVLLASGGAAAAAANRGGNSGQQAIVPASP